MAMQGLRRSNTVAVCRPDANNLLAWFDQGGLFWVELQVSGEVYRADRRRVSHLSTTASPGVLPIGRGRSLTAPPSHTTWHRSRTSTLRIIPLARASGTIEFIPLSFWYDAPLIST